MRTAVVPIMAVSLAVSVSTLFPPPPVSGFGLNDAVTPSGRPEAERAPPH
jgi:hypothetical protein